MMIRSSKLLRRLGIIAAFVLGTYLLLTNFVEQSFEQITYSIIDIFKKERHHEGDIMPTKIDSISQSVSRMLEDRDTLSFQLVDENDSTLYEGVIIK